MSFDDDDGGDFVSQVRINRFTDALRLLTSLDLHDLHGFTASNISQLVAGEHGQTAVNKHGGSFSKTGNVNSVWVSQVLCINKDGWSLHSTSSPHTQIMRNTECPNSGIVVIVSSFCLGRFSRILEKGGFGHEISRELDLVEPHVSWAGEVALFYRMDRWINRWKKPLNKTTAKRRKGGIHSTYTGGSLDDAGEVHFWLDSEKKMKHIL